MSLLQHLSADNAAPFLTFPGGQVSYAWMRQQVDEVARAIGPERRLIAIEAASSQDFITTYLAGLHAGHAMALLPPGDATARTLFEKDFKPAFTFAMEDGAWRMHAHGAEPTPLHPDLAVMLATSGSEGRPRWVRLSRRNIESNAQAIAHYLGLIPQDRAPVTLPFHYSYGLSVLHAQLWAGGSLAFCGESVIAPGFLAQAAKMGCTGFSGVPLTYELLERVQFRERLWPSLRYMTVAGGRLAPSLVSDYDASLRAQGARFFVMYGQTEATARMAYVPPEHVARHPDCIGIAIDGGAFRIDGDTGELFYRGPNVMMGYATAPGDLSRGPEISELATGDIASITTDGLIRLEGRARRFSKIAGLRIGHDGLAWALGARGVSCAVTGTDEQITVHVEGRPAGDLRAIAAEAAGVPASFIRIHKVEQLPRLSSGKIDHAALAFWQSEPVATMPGGLLQDFRAAFYPRAVTPDDSFETLEGDSLAYVQVSLAIENRLGMLPQGWEADSIAVLERQAAAQPQAKAGRMAKIESHIVLRAVAILLIVVHHATLWPVPGGAAALMMMVGYGFARFHRDQLFDGRTGPFLLPMLRNLLPYLVIVAGFAIAWGRVPWASVLLIGNLGFADPAKSTMLPFQFWFVEAYAQLCLVTAAAFSVPAVREAVKRQPFVTAFALLMAAFALRYAVPLVYDIGGRKMFLLTYVLWLPLMGWCAYFAGTLRQKLLLILAAGVLCPLAAYTGGNWQGSWILYMLQFAVVALLLGVPEMRLPRLSVPPIMLISAASYHIYLFHRIVPEFLGLDKMGSLGVVASIGAGLLCGIGAMALQRLAFARLGQRLHPAPIGR